MNGKTNYVEIATRNGRLCKFNKKNTNCNEVPIIPLIIVIPVAAALLELQKVCQSCCIGCDSEAP